MRDINLWRFSFYFVLFIYYVLQEKNKMLKQVLDDKPSQHRSNRSGSMVIKHRTNSSLGNHLDLVNRMVSRWGSMGDGELEAVHDDLSTDDDYDDTDTNGKPKKKKNIAPVSEPPITSNIPKNAGLKVEREALEKAFDQYIDPDQNGDVDVDEWFLGLQKLNVQLNETQQRKIYDFMDKDESGFVEKNDFVMFATARFDDEELQMLQGPILQSVRIQNLHDRTHSNLMNMDFDASQDWNDNKNRKVHGKRETYSGVKPLFGNDGIDDTSSDDSQDAYQTFLDRMRAEKESSSHKNVETKYLRRQTQTKQALQHQGDDFNWVLAEVYKIEIDKFKQKYGEKDRIRKDSISTLHDNIYAKLLEAEAEHEEMTANYRETLEKETIEIKNELESKINFINQIQIDYNEQIQKLQDGNSTICDDLKNQIGTLEKEMNEIQKEYKDYKERQENRILNGENAEAEILKHRVKELKKVTFTIKTKRINELETICDSTEQIQKI